MTNAERRPAAAPLRRLPPCNRRLAWCLLASALGHAVAISLPFDMALPAAPAAAPVLQVSLVPGESNGTPSSPQSTMLPSPAVTSAAVAAIPPQPAAELPQPSLATSATPDATIRLAEPVVSSDEFEQVPFDSSFNLPQAPMPAYWIDLKYVVSEAGQPGAAGQARFRYQAGTDGRYLLGHRHDTLPAPASGGELEQWETLNQGSAGLRVEQSRSPLREDARSRENLQPDQPAVMQALFQFMLHPPGLPGSSGVIATGLAELPGLEYRVVDLQAVPTSALGEVVTLLVQLNAPGTAGGLEVWLGIEWRYLPVEIRYTDPQGRAMRYAVSGFSQE